MTLTGAELRQEAGEFAFFLHRAEQLRDSERRFQLTKDDFALINPNTRTCPIFRTRRDFEITRAIYERVPTFAPNRHPIWNVRLGTLFHSSNDADKFEIIDDLFSAGWERSSNCTLSKGDEIALRLYEGKMFDIFDHRSATVVRSETALVRQRQSQETTDQQHRDPDFFVEPGFWVQRMFVPGDSRWSWNLCFKKVTSPTNERTLISAILPECAANDSVHLLTPEGETNAADVACLLAAMASYPVDYVSRQKLGGLNFNFFVFEQLPLYGPEFFAMPCTWDKSVSIRDWILPRILELTYSAWDLQPFAKDLGYHEPPFIWDEDRRFLLRCELDAAFFHLYGIDKEDVDYIMETFTIVKRKDERRYGEYHSKLTILKMYDEIELAVQTDRPYRARLGPVPEDVSIRQNST
jgi:hypothetical protein